MIDREMLSLIISSPQLFNMSQLENMRAVDRIEHAMGLVERDVNTPRLLQPKGFLSFVFRYISCKTVTIILIYKFCGTHMINMNLKY